MDNQIIGEKLKVVLATAHAFALKAQNYHWNVTGPHFIEYHEFFQEIYEQVYDDTDAYAEVIRTLGMFAPGSLSRFAEMARINDEQTIPTPDVMFARLASGNTIMLNLLNNTHGDATEAKNFAVTSLIEERLQYHEKLGWKLNSLIAA